MDKPHVLDILAKKQGCFVSDLRLNPINRRAALADLLLLDDSAYQQKEWREAAAYLPLVYRVPHCHRLIKRKEGVAFLRFRQEHIKRYARLTS